MKRSVWFLFAITFIALGCNRSGNQETAAEKEKAINSEKVLVLPYSALYNDRSQKIDLKHTTDGDASKLNVNDMVEAINIKYPQIKLQLIKSANDTVHLKVGDSNYLSQSMGSTGSKVYLAESTYALTELKGVKAVEFIFPEGDHASPGVYTRDSFKADVQVK